MKLLKVKTISGYKMLEPNFEINFLTKTRVNLDKDGDDETNELVKITENLFYPLQTIFIGKNSAGKTTTLNFIYFTIRFFINGRLPIGFFPAQNSYETEFIFYHENMIYKYHGIFEKNELINKEYLIIKNEELYCGEIKSGTKKDLSNITYKKVPDFLPNLQKDTSSIARFNYFDATTLVDLFAKDDDSLNFIIEYLNKSYGIDIFSHIVNMFDDSVEYIRQYNDNGSYSYLFKRVQEKEKNVDYGYLERILSSGTYRGIYLFSLSIIAFNIGGHILIDEIEKSFNKNLIENLIGLFANPKINKAKATLIYSTHYSELLDESGRLDNINVLHRKGNAISISNLSQNYDIRTDISRANQFDQNVFDSILNYEKLMGLYKILQAKKD